jgi:S-formylglutathione hydrolase FrmB
MMKNLVLFFLITINFSLFAQKQGMVKESLIVKSTILGKDVKYCIYLPSDYETSNRNYPILYLLHGYSDDDTGWLQFGEVDRIASESIANGDAAPMVIAMPDGGVSWYINSSDGKVKYEDFFVNEFMLAIEKMYRVRANKRYRAIAGLSMGGYGTLVMALKHPDLFSSAAPLSAAVFNETDVINTPEDRWNAVFGVLYGKDLKGKDRMTEHLKNNSPLDIVGKKSLADLSKVKYYIDCGDDDFLIKGNMDLHAALTDKKVPHEFRVRDGGHTWSYWRTALPEVLKFVSQGFHQ